jgi:hypothetical protein
LPTSRPVVEVRRGAVPSVRTERRAHDAARGHAAVATLGQRALGGTDFSLLLDQTVSLVADTLAVSMAAVCEVTDDGLLLRAGYGLIVSVPRQTCLPADRSRFPASALVSETPVCDSPAPNPEPDSLMALEGLRHTVRETRVRTRAKICSSFMR